MQNTQCCHAYVLDVDRDKVTICVVLGSLKRSTGLWTVLLHFFEADFTMTGLNVPGHNLPAEVPPLYGH